MTENRMLEYNLDQTEIESSTGAYIDLNSAFSTVKTVMPTGTTTMNTSVEKSEND